MAKIFITGATGYVGGEVIQAIASKYPAYSISALVRDGTKGAQITSVLPNVKVIDGDLDSADVLKREAAESDIVLNLASSSHLKSVQAIHEGLSQSKNHGHFWVQISGASVLSVEDVASKTFGESSDKIYSDYPDSSVEELKALIRRFPNRAVDNYMQMVPSQTPHIKTAVVIPPIIYGQGRGPVNQRSVQLPELARVTLQRGRTVQVGKGLSRWNSVHIRDLGDLFLHLVENAVADSTSDAVSSSLSMWGENGLYFTGVQEVAFGELSKSVAEAAVKQNFISDSTVDEISPEEADGLTGHASILWGTNARANAQRARKLLGWAPSNPTLEEEIPGALAAEAESLGIAARSS